MVWNQEVLDYIAKVGVIGAVLGILSAGLNEEPMSCRKRCKNLVWSIVFAVMAGLLMKHLELVLPDESSVWIEWLLIGLAAFNQRAIRFLVKIIYHKLVMNPMEFFTNLRKVIKGEKND